MDWILRFLDVVKRFDSFFYFYYFPHVFSEKTCFDEDDLLAERPFQ